MKSHLCNVVKNDYTQVYLVNYGDPQVSRQNQLTSWRKNSTPAKRVDSRQNSQTHGNKTTHDKTNSNHANRNSTHGEKDIFKGGNGESLKQGIFGTWNLWNLESSKRAGESLGQGIFKNGNVVCCKIILIN